MILFVVEVQAQLPWNQDPEGQGMGGISLPISGRYQPMGNPANLASLDGQALGVFTTHPFSQPELATSQIRTVIPIGHGGLGGSIAYSGFNNLRHYALQLGFGHRLWNRLHGGVQLEFNFTQIPEGQIHMNPNIATGLAMTLARSVDLGVWVRNPLPFSGPSSYRTAPQMDITLTYRISELVLIAAEWFQDVSDQADIRLGISYKPIRKLVLRTGYQSRTSSFTAGASYRFRSNWDFSLAAGYHPFLGFTPSAGFGFHLPKNP